MKLWSFVSSLPSKYSVTADCHQMHISSESANPDDFGGIQFDVPLEDVREKRISFSANFQTNDCKNGAALWIRAGNSKFMMSDGIQDRLISGTTEWNKLTLIIDVPTDASYVTYGMFLYGQGSCSLSSPEFQTLENDAGKVTGQRYKYDNEKWTPA